MPCNRYNCMGSQNVADWTLDSTGRLPMMDLYFDTLRAHLASSTVEHNMLTDEEGAREEFLEIWGLLIFYMASTALGAACAIFNMDDPLVRMICPARRWCCPRGGRLDVCPKRF